MSCERWWFCELQTFRTFSIVKMNINWVFPMDNLWTQLTQPCQKPQAIKLVNEMAGLGSGSRTIAVIATTTTTSFWIAQVKHIRVKTFNHSCNLGFLVGWVTESHSKNYEAFSQGLLDICCWGVTVTPQKAGMRDGLWPSWVTPASVGYDGFSLSIWSEVHYLRSGLYATVALFRVFLNNETKKYIVTPYDRKWESVKPWRLA